MVQSPQRATGGGTGAVPASRSLDPSVGTRTETQIESEEEAVQTQGPILRLRGEHPARGRGPRVQWAESVVDNEGMGKKSSKVCCIYHAPKAVDESSDESDSSSSSSSSSDDSDSDAGEGSSSRRGAADGDHAGKGGRHGGDCGHGGGGKHGHGRRRRDAREPRRARKPSPNAYEKAPKPAKPRDGGGGGAPGTG